MRLMKFTMWGEKSIKLGKFLEKLVFFHEPGNRRGGYGKTRADPSQTSPVSFPVDGLYGLMIMLHLFVFFIL